MLSNQRLIMAFFYPFRKSIIFQRLSQLLFVVLLFSTSTRADDGYRLWLKYDRLTKVQPILQNLQGIITPSDSPMLKVAAEELQTAIKGLTGKTLAIQKTANSASIILKINPSEGLNNEGYHLSRSLGNLVISAQTEVGLLYGSFALLREIQTLQPLEKLNVTSSPKVQHRLLNHWDNNNGSIERGYAGSTLWHWFDLPDVIDPRYRDYARANASIGINGTVLNNVNASARFLTPEYLKKVAALADVFRPYGIKVYLSVFFAAPKTLGGLKTSDPLDPEVKRWWAEKTKEIYTLIPDFGGYLVKANSEGEPGPQDYNRTHADGARMLSEALMPYPQGVVMWRSFVYKADPNGDRFKEGYEEFKPLDGKFDPNVLVQVKNGPIDFQPREPFHPLFGAMPQTPLVMEFQLTQEYLGFATHLAYMAPLFKECLDSDTYAKGKGSTVAKVIDGSVHGYQKTGMAGVANTGSDRNWTGHPMGQANWYAFGRLAWNYSLSSDKIAEEWIRLTLTNDNKAVSTIQDMMLHSRETLVNYMTPLGLHHIMGNSLHYGPNPWLAKNARPDWTSVYYHKADEKGIGFDRTESGSNALGLYAPEVQKQWSLAACPPEYLLWFHHVPWTHPMPSGRILWDELCHRYYEGVAGVARLQLQWDSVKSQIDPELFTNVKGRLSIQHREALWWRDACVLYFQTLSKRPIPEGLEKPTRTLEEVKKLVDVYQIR